MKLHITLFISALLFCFKQAPASDFIDLDQSVDWQFSNQKTGQVTPVVVGHSLTDQFWKNECCVGNYKITLKGATLNKIRQMQTPALFLPAIGGLRIASIGKSGHWAFRNDFSSLGPILPISKIDLFSDSLSINLRIESKVTNFSGLWKAAPSIGEIEELIRERDINKLFQEDIPKLNFFILFLFSIVFLLIHLSVGKKNPIYKNFSFCLFSWSIFYIFLSGYFRSLNYFIFSAAHYPVRIIASYGLMLLVNRAVGKTEENNRFLIFVIIASITNFAAGILEYPIFQIISLSAVALISFLPLLSINFDKIDSIGNVLVILSIVALTGQLSDALKLLSGIFNITYKVPFLNRWTFLPLLLTSFGDCIVQFSASYHQTRKHLFKTRIYARTILFAAKNGLSHDNVDYFLKVVSRITGYTRASLSQKQDNGTYSIIKLYGSKFPATGNAIDHDRIPEISNSISTGQIQFGIVKKVSNGWNTPAFTSIPVPQQQNPPYLLLLSDPLNTKLDPRDLIPYLTQISAGIWTNLERTKEQNLRVKTEKQFSALVQRLDPNLYSFISKNIGKFTKIEAGSSDIRGIVFFDQKSYSTMIETFDDTNMSTFAQIVGEWVTTSASRFGARISNFAGDSFLLETFKIGSEGEEVIGLRTLDLVWNLAQNLSNLNQTLLAYNFSPVTFRFGAHIGNVTLAKLDFIQQGYINSIGDTVNIAARLQALAKPGTIYISEELAKFTSNKYTLTLVPREYVKGRSKKIKIYSLIGSTQETSNRKTNGEIL